MWSGFRTKTVTERKELLLASHPALQPAQPPTDAELEKMVENCIGSVPVPLGLALNFTINGSLCIIPMAVEEASVIAAVSGAAKTISQHSGFTAHSSPSNVTTAQIQMADIENKDMDPIISLIALNQASIIMQANLFCPTMVARGGGVSAIVCRKVRRSTPKPNCDYWLILHLHINVCESMGANCATTVAEGVAPFISKMTGAQVGLRIISNLGNERLTTASFKIPLERLEYKGFSGTEVAERIVEAYEWAKDDKYRAVTHNKGIMNGIDAVAVATGQDWRAIEAACHAWASTESGYQPLTRYWIDKSTQPALFCGELILPLHVGTKGGVLKTHPTYNYALGIMGFPTSAELAMSMACVGLAQNFAALRALCTEGISRGHMALHARK